MGKSIKKNFIWNLLLTCSNYIIPLITYPYSSRVLGVENMGICGYVDSIINYFILFASLGIIPLGIREIAKAGDDKEKRSVVFSSLVSFNVAMSFILAVVLVVITYMLPSLSEYKEFLLIGLFKLISQAFLIEWFYQGIQDFRYITIRSVSIKCLYVVSLFVFVRTKNDVSIYYLLNVLMIVVNSIWNLAYSQKFVKYNLSNIRIRVFLPAILSFGYYLILTSIYTTFNVTFLGITNNNTEVGYYVTASKLNTIIMAAFTAFTTVMVPAISSMLKENDTVKLNGILNKSLSTIIAISAPIIAFCIVFAPEVILLLSGPGYEGAITPFRIIIFLIMIIGMEQVIIQQFLLSSGKLKSITLLSTTGAIVGLALNFIFTIPFGSVGSSIAWGGAEVVVLILGTALLRKHMNLIIDFKSVVNDILSVLVYLLPLIVCSYLISNRIIAVLLSLLYLVALFIIINIKMKRNEVIANSLDTFAGKIKEFGRLKNN